MSVLDPFSAASLGAALDLWSIQPENIETDLDLIDPQLVLVESAWSGNDGAWVHQLTGPSGPKPSILRLLDEARSRGIPTVFWNKEDPPHFDDFLPLAKHFDHVLTTEGSLVDRYVAEGAGSAGVLQFAASPELHNPIAVEGQRRGGVCFAGQYFRHKFPERREQMDMLFAATDEAQLTIYSRVLGGDERYQFPQAYTPRVRGSLPYDEMVHEYKRHRVFLNVNSVPSSETMCARRIFELAATKTAVLTPRSPAIAAVFADDEVLQVESTEEARAQIERMLADPLERLRVGQRAWRRVAKAHLYEDRVAQIATRIGIERRPARPTLGVVLRTTDDELGAALSALMEQRVRDLIAGPLRVAIRDRQTNAPLAPPAAQLPGLHFVSDWSSPEFATDFVASVRSSDRIGKHYLSDQLLLISRFPVGDVVTKPAWRDLSPDRGEERLVERIRRSTWLARHSHASRLLALEDQGTEILEVGAYSSDPFSFAAADDSAPTGWEA